LALDLRPLSQVWLRRAEGSVHFVQVSSWLRQVSKVSNLEPETARSALKRPLVLKLETAQSALNLARIAFSTFKLQKYKLFLTLHHFFSVFYLIDRFLHHFPFILS